MGIVLKEDEDATKVILVSETKRKHYQKEADGAYPNKKLRHST